MLSSRRSISSQNVKEFTAAGASRPPWDLTWGYELNIWELTTFSSFCFFLLPNAYLVYITLKRKSVMNYVITLREQHLFISFKLASASSVNSLGFWFSFLTKVRTLHLPLRTLHRYQSNGIWHYLAYKVEYCKKKIVKGVFVALGLNSIEVLDPSKTPFL